MSKNPYLNKLLGEAVAPEDTEVPSPEAKTTPPPVDQPVEPEAKAQGQTPPTANLQQLLKLWQSGEHMGVATRLMFTESSYVEFVDLSFAIGHEQARELGTLLDELADTEGMKPPKTPPEYSDTLRRAVGSGTEEEVV